MSDNWVSGAVNNLESALAEDTGRVIPGKFLPPDQQSRSREVRITTSNYNGSAADIRNNPRANDAIGLLKSNQFEREARNPPSIQVGMKTVPSGFINNPSFQGPQASTGGGSGINFDVYDTTGTKVASGTDSFTDANDTDYQYQQYYVTLNGALCTAFLFSSAPAAV